MVVLLKSGRAGILVREVSNIKGLSAGGGDSMENAQNSSSTPLHTMQCTWYYGKYLP
jgi:hypothetical protein